jgi:DNA mismatch endonuclease (patch repair protein)
MTLEEGSHSAAGDEPKPKRRGNVPPASSKAALDRMMRTGRRDTGAEHALRAALFRMGLRYRVDFAPLPGIRRRADVVFTRAKVAVFVDGCFWHGCPEHGTWPKANADFWRAKIEANGSRDVDTNRRFEEAGWVVIRVWEHEEPGAAARAVAKVVQRASRKLRGKR